MEIYYHMVSEKHNYTPSARALELNQEEFRQ